MASTTYELVEQHEEVARRLLAAGASVAGYAPEVAGSQLSILVSSSGDVDLVECVIADLIAEGFLKPSAA